jgi:ABC-2 type transport system permease protein
MRGFRQLTWITFKLYLREPIATFFTLAFPTMLVVLFGSIYGNEPAAIFGGRGSMDVSLPAYSGLIVGTIGLMSVPITIAGYREQGILRRFRVTPLKPWTYILADQCTNLLMTVVGMAIVSAVAWLLYRVEFQGRVLAVLLAVVLGTLAMSALGYIIASVAKGARVAQVISMVIFYPMMFLSGAGMPIEILPDSIQRISDFLPLTYVVRLTRGLWFGDSLGTHGLEAGILAGITLVGGLLAARLFRWE